MGVTTFQPPVAWGINFLMGPEQPSNPCRREGKTDNPCHNHAFPNGARSSSGA